MSYRPIENYGVIGDLTTTALVGMDGSIDFMCFPHFDSPTIFAALLDHKKGGHFKISPVAGKFKNHQRYFPNTNILFTRFLGESGIAEVSDFMAMEHLGHSHSLIRRIKAVRGEIKFRMVFAPKFNYDRTRHTIEKKSPHEFIFIPGGKNLPALRLRTSVRVKIENGEAVAEFKMSAGKKTEFILEAADEKSPSANHDYVSEAFKETMNFWLGWVGHSKYNGRWREMVDRSALTLKLLTSRPHGSIVAAPTFGLPEKIGGTLNWDYRYSWIRDASFTLCALMRLGYTGEAQAFMRWIEKRCQDLKAGRPLQVMYRMDGGRDITERTLRNLEGYRKSSPVRTGNAASQQLQLDIYGELLNAVLIYDQHDEPISFDLWRNIETLIEWVCKNWNTRGAGIWEERDEPRQFLYSKVMCWMALDSAIQLARRRSFPAPLVRWHRVRDKIYLDIYENYWNPKLKSFVQYRGANTVDASALLMPMMKFISPVDPRWKSTMQAIEEKLVEDSLVYRHKAKNATAHSRHEEEGTFSPCSFWYVECLARAGDLKQARYIFEKTLGYANHLGLYAEELGSCGEHLGNFPLGLSHTALISAACNLDERLSKSG